MLMCVRRLFCGRATLRSRHLVTGSTLGPESWAEYLLGASAQLSSEGTQKKVGSISQESQMPRAKKTSSLKSGTGDLPFFMAPSAA